MMTTLANPMPAMRIPTSGKVKDTTPAIPVPVKMTAKQLRKQTLANHRLVILTATAGNRAAGGSDVAGRAFRAMGLLNGKDVVTIDDVIFACEVVNTKKLIQWANSYLDGLVENKGREARRKAINEFAERFGFKELGAAISALVQERAFTWSETFQKAGGKSITYTVDLGRELNDMFGLKLTNMRRVKFCTMGK